MKIIQLFILLIVVIAVGYIVGLNVVNVVDKRLANISINIPKQELVFNVNNQPKEPIIEPFSDHTYLNEFHEADLKPIEMGKRDPTCYYNHTHKETHNCKYGSTNFGDPQIMSDVDRNVFKYNFNYTKSTLQDYVNWLYLFVKTPHELPYNHVVNLKKLLNNKKITRIPKINYQLNAGNYFNKIHNLGVDGYKSKISLNGFNINKYSGNNFYKV